MIFINIILIFININFKKYLSKFEKLKKVINTFITHNYVLVYIT